MNENEAKISIFYADGGFRVGFSCVKKVAFFTQIGLYGVVVEWPRVMIQTHSQSRGENQFLSLLNRAYQISFKTPVRSGIDVINAENKTFSNTGSYIFLEKTLERSL